jgi:hypothetical protein
MMESPGLRMESVRLTRESLRGAKVSKDWDMESTDCEAETCGVISINDIKNAVNNE